MNKVGDNNISLTWPDGSPKSLVFDPTKETAAEAANRLGLPAEWLIPDVRKPGAMEAPGYEEAFEISGQKWYRRKEDR